MDLVLVSGFFRLSVCCLFRFSFGFFFFLSPFGYGQKDSSNFSINRNQRNGVKVVTTGAIST